MGVLAVEHVYGRVVVLDAGVRVCTTPHLVSLGAFVVVLDIPRHLLTSVFQPCFLVVVEDMLGFR